MHMDNHKGTEYNENFIIITTYVASGMSSQQFLDERLHIMQLSTGPSICSQTMKNFIWLIYFDKLNSPAASIQLFKDLLQKYKTEINVHIIEYEPFLVDGSLVLHNRARSCCKKRYSLYNEALNYCEKARLLEGKKYVAHTMLDDDDPILPHHIKWINKKMNLYRDDLSVHKGAIIINKSQYLLYINELTAFDITSTKALKGCSFIFYKKENAATVNFHPYSILEPIPNNHAYLDKYGIKTHIVNDKPSWVYFRHKMSTSNYNKDYIVEKENNKYVGTTQICEIMSFYNVTRLMNLYKYLATPRKDDEVLSWVTFRKDKLKKVLFLVEDYGADMNGRTGRAFMFYNFMKNNFENCLIYYSDDTRFIKKYNVNTKKLVHIEPSKKDISGTITTALNPTTLKSKLLEYEPTIIIVFGIRKTVELINSVLDTVGKKYIVINFDYEKRYHSINGRTIKGIQKWDNVVLMGMYREIFGMVYNCETKAEMDKDKEKEKDAVTSKSA